MSRPVYIYTLSCPFSGMVKYIGKTTNCKLRYNQHTSDRRNLTKVKSWLKSLKIKGHNPILEVIEICDEHNWRFWESYWICQFKAWGFVLKNMIDGGLGLGVVPIEVRKRISSSLKGRKLSWSAEKVLGKKVCQYDLQGNYLKTYESIKGVEREHGFFDTNIGSAIRRKQSAYGFQWRYFSTLYDKNIGAYLRNNGDHQKVAESLYVPVIEVDEEGNTIKEYTSIREAEDDTGIFNIGAVCRGVRKRAGGKYFKYKSTQLL